jgi:hypothetical protein
MVARARHEAEMRIGIMYDEADVRLVLSRRTKRSGYWRVTSRPGQAEGRSPWFRRLHPEPGFTLIVVPTRDTR